MIYPIDYRVIPASELELNKNEVFARLQTARNADISMDFECVAELEKNIVCKYSSVRTSVSFGDGNRLNCGFGEIVSADLTKNLRGCDEVFVFAVTLGVGVDRFLNKLALTSPANHFIADAFASAYAESAADKAEEIMKGSLKCHPRFSPGYGDLELSCQKPLLELVNAGRLLGINLNKSLLMSPTKSITAIVGIEK